MTEPLDLRQQLLGAGDGALHAFLGGGELQLAPSRASILRRSCDMDSGMQRISR
jgi:hypothetical protein